MLKVANSVINASQITGVLPVVNGGTGVTTSTGTGNTVLSASPTLSGNVNLSTGNLVIGTANKGIDFSITSSGTGTMTSELLADYEEGTWTPSVGGTATYTAQTGKYTKVGRLVTVTGHIQINVLGTGSTTTLSGLPFNNADLTPISVGYWSGLAVNVIYISGYIGAAGSTILFVSGTTSSGTANNAIALFGNSADIYFSATYVVFA